MTTETKLTAEEIQAINAVGMGADVYAYGLAVTLRGIEKNHPGLVMIVEPQAYTGDGTDQMPYFGCVATKKGQRVAQIGRSR